MSWYTTFPPTEAVSWPPPPPPLPPRLPLPSPSPPPSISPPSPPSLSRVPLPPPSPLPFIPFIPPSPSIPSPPPSPGRFSPPPLLPSFPALHLYPVDYTFTIKHIPLFNNRHVKIGRLVTGKTAPTDTNGLFDSKVLSRWHAKVWEEDGKIFIKDTKSWNGTFINGKRLSPEGVESPSFELKTDDIVDFGRDIRDSGGEATHYRVSARVRCVLNHQDLESAAIAEQHHWRYRPQGIAPQSSMLLSPTPPELLIQYPAIYLYPINDTFVVKYIRLSGNRRVKIGRQTSRSNAPSDDNGYFAAKVLSTRHAEVWEERGKIFIKDLQSSNGTFINGKRLSPEGVESRSFELKTNDIVDFGVDVGADIKHHKVSARIVCVFNDQDVQIAARKDVRIHEEDHSLTLLLRTLKSEETMNDMIINEDDLDLVRKLLDSSDDNSIIFWARDSLDVKLFLNFILYLLQHRYLSAVEDIDQKVQRLLFKSIFKADAISLWEDDVKFALGLDTAVGKHGGRRVALRLTYQIRHENNSRTKNYYRDVLAWRSINHRHILPLLGISELGPHFFLVSPLTTNGTLTEWRKEQTPNVAEIHKMMQEVAEGVLHIHSKGIVHGDLCGENILLDSNFLCQITGFGLTRRSATTTSLMLNFAAPELFSRDDSGRPDLIEYHYMEEGKTMKTDVYAFGCLYYAIFFDSLPFQEIVKEQIPKLIVDGKRPARFNSPLMDDGVWKIIQNCWSHNVSERPMMEQILQTPSPVSTPSLRTLGDSLVNENTLRRVRELLDLPESSIIQFASEESNNSNIKLLLDFILCLLREGSLMHCGIQDANRRARKLMLKLLSTDAIPESLFITNVKTDLEHIGVGGFARVFVGKYKGQQVALKMLDKIHKKKGSLSQDFCQEALAWRSLSHRFILPLLGIFETKSQLYLVSPLMKNGTLSDWRKKKTPSISELHRVIIEVAEGVQYIHSEGIVHGDLHGGNVLLDPDFHCQITDFGSTRHSEATITQSTTALSLSFAAPELFGMCIKCSHFDCEGCYEDSEEYHRSKTMKTDIYAFGCLYYAIFFNTVPFDGANDFQIIRLLTRGRRPLRLRDPEMADNTWDPIQGCWKSIPSERPAIEQIMRMLTS